MQTYYPTTSLQHQSNQSVRCPKCHQPPYSSTKGQNKFYTYHECHPNCNFRYWTLNQCFNQCSNPHQTIFLQHPQFNNEVIQCQNCKVEFYNFICPRENCKRLFQIHKKQYLFGYQITCSHCKYVYKSLMCKCGQQKIFQINQTIYAGQQIYDCNLCQKPLVFTYCLKCAKINRHEESLEIGSKFKCIHCKFVQLYVPCPKCGRQNRQKEFKYGKRYDCRLCKASFEYSKCSQCNCQNYHMDNNPIRVCTNNTCKKTYYAVSCNKCQNLFNIKELKQGQGREQACPHCQNIIKFYHCFKCKQINWNDSKCNKTVCPDPKQLRSISDQVLKEKWQKRIIRKEQQMNESFNAEQCKLCYNQKSSMVNVNCGHLMMCLSCYMKYRQGQKIPNSEKQTPCPICKNKGVYMNISNIKFS